MIKIITLGRNKYKSIKCENLLYLKANGNYTEIITIDQKILVSGNLKKIKTEIFYDDIFIRISRKLVVNYNNIDTFVTGKNSYVKLVNGIKLKPSVRMKKNLLLAPK